MKEEGRRSLAVQEDINDGERQTKSECKHTWVSWTPKEWKISECRVAKVEGCLQHGVGSAWWWTRDVALPCT